MQTKLQTEFTFAGFAWPRYVADMACGPDALRRKREQRKVTGGYYHAPRPNANEGKGFYLGDAGMPCNRYELTGREWYADDECIDTIQGLILLLPHGRFLAGYTMGQGMSSGVDADVFTDKDEAEQRADECARIVAEKERDYQASERERLAEDERESAIGLED